MEYVKEYWGNTEYYKNGVLHRDGDLPAVISARGDLEYYKNGRRHRDNGPAVIRKNGVCSWYKNGVHLKTCQKTRVSTYIMFRNQKKGLIYDGRYC